MQKRILNSKRLRHVPARFSWVDHQLIRRRLLCGADSTAWALYLFLVTVGDEHGLSYYSDASICSHLNVCNEDLCKVRRQLLERRLIAWESPLYQVLCVRGGRQAGERSGSKTTTLPGTAAAERTTLMDPSPAVSEQERHINGLRMAEALSELIRGGKS